MALFNIGNKRSDDMSSVVNSAKTLLANIRFMDVDNPVRTMAVTSSVPNEGKTFVAANLASAIATSGKTVLLVECDMRRRSMSRALGVHGQNGIYSVMARECSLRDAVVATPTPNLYFLDAEPRIPNPSDLLNSHRFLRFVEQARSTFDYVLFDTPPVGTFIDAAVLGTKVDAVFMVVREGFTKKAEIVAAAEQLRKSGCNLAGVIMNFCERSSNEYYYEYYYSREESGPGSDEGPKPVPAGRPQRVADARVAPASAANANVPVPAAPPARRRRAAAEATPAPTPAPAAAPTASLDDTDTYERLAEQVAQTRVARQQAPAAVDQPVAGRQVPVVPRVNTTDEEF